MADPKIPEHRRAVGPKPLGGTRTIDPRKAKARAAKAEKAEPAPAPGAAPRPGGG